MKEWKSEMAALDQNRQAGVDKDNHNLSVRASRDAAIVAFVTSTDGNDIQLALEWANRIEGPNRRVERMEQAARRWLDQDNAAARAWLSKAELPAGMAERLATER